MLSLMALRIQPHTTFKVAYNWGAAAAEDDDEGRRRIRRKSRKTNSFLDGYLFIHHRHLLQQSSSSCPTLISTAASSLSHHRQGEKETAQEREELKETGIPKRHFERFTQGDANESDGRARMNTVGWVVGR